MTTFAQARETIYQRWNDNWTATPLADTTFAGEQKFPVPENRNWARLSVRNEASAGQTLGAPGTRKFTRQGRIFVQLYAPLSEQDGEGQLGPLVQDAINVFEGVSFTSGDSTIRCFQALPRETGEDGGKWITAIVEVRFDYHETR